MLNVDLLTNLNDQGSTCTQEKKVFSMLHKRDCLTLRCCTCVFVLRSPDTKHFFSNFYFFNVGQKVQKHKILYLKSITITNTYLQFTNSVIIPYHLLFPYT